MADVLMRFWRDGSPEVLPADWAWHLETLPDGNYRIRIDRPTGKRMTLPQALDFMAIQTTASRPEVRLPRPSVFVPTQE